MADSHGQQSTLCKLTSQFFENRLIGLLLISVRNQLHWRLLSEEEARGFSPLLCARPPGTTVSTCQRQGAAAVGKTIANAKAAFAIAGRTRFRPSARPNFLLL